MLNTNHIASFFKYNHCVHLQTQLPVHLQVRLQACVEGYSINTGPPSSGGGVCEGLETHLEGWLLRWLQKLQFKMGQIEIQSSTASQFYNVQFMSFPIFIIESRFLKLRTNDNLQSVHSIFEIIKFIKLFVFGLLRLQCCYLIINKIYSIVLIQFLIPFP